MGSSNVCELHEYTLLSILFCQSNNISLYIYIYMCIGILNIVDGVEVNKDPCN